MLDSILSKWGLYNCKTSVTGNRELEPRIWEVGSKYYLKCANKIEIIENLYVLSKSLEESGLPVAVPLKTKDDNIFVPENDKFFYLTRKLPGKPFDDFQNYDWTKYGYLIGKAIADFHIGLCACENKITNAQTRDYHKQITDWAVPIIKEKIPATETKARQARPVPAAV